MASKPIAVSRWVQQSLSAFSAVTGSDMSGLGALPAKMGWFAAYLAQAIRCACEACR